MLGIKCWRVDYDNKSKGYPGDEAGTTFFKTKEEAEKAIETYKAFDLADDILHMEYTAVEVTI